MNIDPVKFGADLNHTVIGLERMLGNWQIQKAINDPAIIRGMMGFLATVQGFANDPVAWPKFVAWLNGLSQ